MQLVATTREEAHRACLIAYDEARRLLLDGRVVLLSAVEHEEDRTLAQLRYYFGVVIKEISEQASIDGVRWAPQAWHELAKRLYLGYEHVKIQVAGRPRPTYYRRLKSLGKQKLRTVSKYIDQVTAWAVTDLGVAFSEARPRWEPERKL